VSDKAPISQGVIQGCKDVVFDTLVSYGCSGDTIVNVDVITVENEVLALNFDNTVLIDNTSERRPS